MDGNDIKKEKMGVHDDNKETRTKGQGQGRGHNGHETRYNDDEIFDFRLSFVSPFQYRHMRLLTITDHTHTNTLRWCARVFKITQLLLLVRVGDHHPPDPDPDRQGAVARLWNEARRTLEPQPATSNSTPLCRC